MLLPRGTVGQGRVHRGTSLPAVRTLAVRFMSSHRIGLSRSPVIPPRTGSAPPAWPPAPEHASEAGCSPPCPSWEARGRIPESSGTPANTSGGQSVSSQGFHHVTTKRAEETLLRVPEETGSSSIRNLQNQGSELFVLAPGDNRGTSCPHG